MNHARRTREAVELAAWWRVYVKRNPGAAAFLAATVRRHKVEYAVEWQRQPEVKARRAAYYARPDVKARRRRRYAERKRTGGAQGES